MGCFLRMNSREMIGEFRSLRQALSGWLDSATLSLLIAGISAQDHSLRRSQELCHNCDTKPVFTVKTDFIDDVRLLILRNLLKAKNWPTNPAYRLARQLFQQSSGIFPQLLPFICRDARPISLEVLAAPRPLTSFVAE